MRRHVWRDGRGGLGWVNLRTQQTNDDHSEWSGDQISGHLPSLEEVTHD